MEVLKNSIGLFMPLDLWTCSADKSLDGCAHVVGYCVTAPSMLSLRPT